MSYTVVITDPWPIDPGKTEYGPFLTRTAAQNWIETEKALLARTMADGGKDVTFEIIRQSQSMEQDR